MKAGAQPHTHVTLTRHNVPPGPLHNRPIKPYGNGQLIKGNIHFLHMQCDTLIVHYVCEDKTCHMRCDAYSGLLLMLQSVITRTCCSHMWPASERSYCTCRGNYNGFTLTCILILKLCILLCWTIK